MNVYGFNSDTCFIIVCVHYFKRIVDTFIRDDFRLPQQWFPISSATAYIKY